MSWPLKPSTPRSRPIGPGTSSDSCRTTPTTPAWCVADGTAMFAGKEVMREQYRKLFADSPGLNLTIASRMTAGDFVVDEEHVSGLSLR